MMSLNGRDDRKAVSPIEETLEHIPWISRSSHRNGPPIATYSPLPGPSQPLQSEQHSQPVSKASPSYPWKPGLWVRLPYPGIGALILVVLLTGGAVGILLSSNGDPISSWGINGFSIQPQVWLSILSTIMNMLLGYAFIEGLTVLFWRRLGRGTKLRNLHDDFESMSLYPAVIALLRGRFGVAAIACLLVTASTVRGPLFQRASTVNQDHLRTHEGVIEIPIAQCLPSTYSWLSLSGEVSLDASDGGFAMGLEVDPNGLAPLTFMSVINGLTVPQVSLPNGIACGEHCTTIIKGAGFDISCNASSDEIRLPDDDELKPCDPDAERGELSYCDPEATHQQEPMAKVFSMGYDTHFPEASYVEFTISTTYKDVSTCTGEVQTHRCTLRPAVVEYAVILKNETISLQHSHWQNDTVVQDATFPGFGFVDWGMVLSLMYPPVQVNVTRSYGLPVYNLAKFIECNNVALPPSASNTSCRILGPTLLNDLSCYSP